MNGHEWVNKCPYIARRHYLVYLRQGELECLLPVKRDIYSSVSAFIDFSRDLLIHKRPRMTKDVKYLLK